MASSTLLHPVIGVVLYEFVRLISPLLLLFGRRNSWNVFNDSILDNNRVHDIAILLVQRCSRLYHIPGGRQLQCRSLRRP